MMDAPRTPRSYRPITASERRSILRLKAAGMSYRKLAKLKHRQMNVIVCVVLGPVKDRPGHNDAHKAGQPVGVTSEIDHDDPPTN